MNKTNQITSLIDGAHYMGEDGLREYHTAQAIKASLRIRNFVERFYAVKRVLHAYRVSVTIGENETIRVTRHDTKQELVFGKQPTEIQHI